MQHFSRGEKRVLPPEKASLTARICAFLIDHLIITFSLMICQEVKSTFPNLDAKNPARLALIALRGSAVLS